MIKHGTQDAVSKDLMTLASFVSTYCRGRHRDRAKAPLRLRVAALAEVAPAAGALCASCRRLLAHALMKRLSCPMTPKPACRACPNHCYAPAYRDAIRKVMRYAGPRYAASGGLARVRRLLGMRR